MTKKKKQSYIAASIAYANAPPHIGFALEVVQADVLARYRRLLGKETFFLFGADEHGAKVAKTAEKAGKNPKEFVDEISEKFKALKKTLNLSNDDFIRTSDKIRHWPAVSKVWLKLKKNRDIYKKNYKGLYCSGCEAFITKKDLNEGKCAIHLKEPEIIDEENYFFRLSRYGKKIKRAIEKDRLKIIPEFRKNEVLSFLKQGLEDISFSRPRKDLKWGIPTPDDETATIYVWADALSNYISALGYADNSSLFKKFWPADVHCIGKDILRFHAIIWPAMLFSLKLPLPKNIFVHGFIAVNGQKMSKSLGNVIDPFELVKQYGTDAVRYYLLREIPATEDGDFTYEKFETRYNADLAAGLGNLTARVIAMAARSNPKSKTPKENLRFPTGQVQNPKQIQNSKFKTILNKTRENYKKSLNEFKFNEALIVVWDLIHFCDAYIEKERPWEKSEKQLLVINNLLFALANIAEMLRPFLPQTSEKIFEQLGVKPEEKQWKFNVKKSAPLFPRINNPER